MTQHIYILTGASRGMGLAMAEQLIAPDHRLLCLSRQVNPALAAKAKAASCTLEQWPCDLSQGVAAAALLSAKNAELAKYLLLQQLIRVPKYHFLGWKLPSKKLPLSAPKQNLLEMLAILKLGKFEPKSAICQRNSIALSTMCTAMKWLAPNNVCELKILKIELQKNLVLMPKL